VQTAGIVSADDHGEGVVETQWRADGGVVALRVEAADGVVDLLRIAVYRLLENSGERCSGVFDIGVDASGDEGLVADVGPGEIEAALDREVGLGFDFLREKLAEDDLLGEIFGSDDGMVGAWRSARGEGK